MSLCSTTLSTPQEKGKEPAQKIKASAAAGPEVPFVFSNCLPPVPAKLVAKITKGDYVDMAELLRDNIEAEHRRAADQPGTSSSVSQPQRREVPDFLSWLQCFGVYACIVASHKPEKFRQLMAYQTIMIREARRLGGGGWQGYDNMFRQLAATVASTDWGQLNSTLYTVTFMAQQNGRGKTCQYCLETDHQGPDCALAPKKIATSASGQVGLGLLTPPATDSRRGGSGSGGWLVGGTGVESCKPASGKPGRPTRRGATRVVSHQPSRPATRGMREHVSTSRGVAMATSA